MARSKGGRRRTAEIGLVSPMTEGELAERERALREFAPKMEAMLEALRRSKDPLIEKLREAGHDI